ncbi:MAG TPA: pyrroloquinoline-quinone synthase PqqC [Chloroflexota bacterium]|jgi:pyrroloquinoline-quinone synthase|nr:pyrroloquinoline-quinone synthase PqqC [Chloroflexota bacterium]
MEQRDGVVAQPRAPWTEEQFRAALQAVGGRHYHDKHPFHQRMNSGRLTRPQLQTWAVNRFYYQRSIPLKDAAILSNCPDPAVRRRWITRIIDHDGEREGTGGIEAWLRLIEALGVPRARGLDEAAILPGVRFAVDAYVTFARTRPWIIAVASSLTELFAPDLMSKRIAAFEQFYPWVEPEGLRYFRSRLTQAPRDSEHALELVFAHCTTRELQEQAVAALDFKCDVLWAQLDAIEQACRALDQDPERSS